MLWKLSVSLPFCHDVCFLAYLPNNIHQLTSLKILCIKECENIKCLPNRGLPPYLKCLQVGYCGALEVELFLPLPITMSGSYLHSCLNIKYLSSNLDQLTSLWEIQIGKCHNIRCLLEGGLPPDICEFYIWECKNMKMPMREWGLH